MPTKLVRIIIKRLLWMISHTPYLKKADLSKVVCDMTESLVNLPGRLAFFPHYTTEIGQVKALLRRLHPISCEKKLVRLGPDGDGGYLVPNDLAGISACFSPGVSTISGFEIDCAQLGMEVYMADASVEAPQYNHPRFHFIKKFIGAESGGNFISLPDWVRTSHQNALGDLMLQMDIEGYEYETILSTPVADLSRFRIIVIEFHFIDRLFCSAMFPFYSGAFNKLLSTHTCVHIHPNNVCSGISVSGINIPQMAEFTFLRNDRIINAVSAKEFPHELDQRNVPDKSDVSLGSLLVSP